MLTEHPKFSSLSAQHALQTCITFRRYNSGLTIVFPSRNAFMKREKGKRCNSHFQELFFIFLRFKYCLGNKIIPEKTAASAFDKAGIYN
jgi:hypothetical protein